MPVRYHLWISGCQMNTSDARWLGEILDGAGMSATSRFDDADVAVMYTCSVRQSAENRVHGQLGHLKSIKARRPGMVICVTGCMAGANQDDLRKRYPWVDHFVSPTEMEQLPHRILSEGTLDEACVPSGGAYGPAVPVSAGLTIIRGCDKYCTYCIVPYRRGRQVSRTQEEVLSEAENLISRGAREVVLLGQTVDAWGRDLDPAASFASLLSTVGALPGLRRLRFLTSHPEDFSLDILGAFGSTPALCEEINLPIQAGDDQTLRRMARPYRVDDYLSLVDKIKSSVPGIALSTDVIVGFPGESESHFSGTMRVLREVEFDIVHVAAYSPRPGTAAARKMEDDVPADMKTRRLHEVESLQMAIATRKNAALEGQTVEVLVEGKEKGKWSGRTRTNKLVFFQAEEDLAGELVRIRVDRSGAWSLGGVLVSDR